MLRAGRGRQPQADMDAALAIDLLESLERLGLPIWLDGGWGIDALLGEQTRNHDDLDVLVRLPDVAQIDAALSERGYRVVRGAPPTSFELVDGQGHQLDVHPVSFAPTGGGVYRMENGQDWVYPPSAFSGVGTILGRRVACLTPEMMMVSHTTGYALDAAHRRDVAALSERYGIPVPGFRADSG